MAIVAVIGAQWGAEGKAHIVDLLAARARLVLRYGGDSAEHTVVTERGSFRLNYIPAGIFDPNTVNVISGSVVLDPALLVRELQLLRESDVSTSRLYLSDRAHVVMPYHVLQDEREDLVRADGGGLTLRRGVTAAYADKIARLGIRTGDLLQEETLLASLRRVLDHKNRLLTRVYGLPALSLHEVYLRYLEYGRQLADYITDTHLVVEKAVQRNVPILLEGSQGAMLDIDHGTYPYVSAAAPGAAGACQAAGISPSRLHATLGVFKAYTTRLDAGPFPTEVLGAEAATLLQIGTPWAEVGEGQRRRVGWFDAVAARYVAEINGIDCLAITKLDVLDGCETVKICVGYRKAETELTHLPTSAADLRRVEPIYETLPGWQRPIGQTRHFEKLPDAARAYVARLCELIGARLALVSVGPDRAQIIEVSRVF